ncbi:transposon Ty3-G Gag-Pol polyprotein [Trichonephila inaurata madagascariensis]|uniref:Transposon Ty3-G Gag-Pol polyprotein n=1 Tax=Trichonephila inaurata madagascariensis TaxID=2747483 RepID=A0A8X6WPB2_9ARAC|nr:transposon Ty3-G Gag-Pol polyprotein [Trichonephila inaurata madagascariensis]
MIVRWNCEIIYSDRFVEINLWQKLKQALIDEFPLEINFASLHELFRNRKIRDCETASEYFLKIKELCNLGKIADAALVHYVIMGTEELHLQNCLKDVKEDKACIPFKKTDPVVVVPECVPKEVKRRAHEKRRPRIKENKDDYFIPKLKQKMENSTANCDHRVLMNHKRRKKTYH